MTEPRYGHTGYNRRWNFESLTHRTAPFLFGPTLCGLRVIRSRKARSYDRLHSTYSPCRRCLPQVASVLIPYLYRARQLPALHPEPGAWGVALNELRTNFQVDSPPVDS